MKILVTGAAGFIGSNFVYYYLNKNENDTIIALDKLTYAGNLENLSLIPKDQSNRFIFVRGDISDSKLIDKILNMHDITYIINFAAETHVDRSIESPNDFIISNIIGTQTLLDVARKHWHNSNDTWSNGRKFIQISTDEVYGSLGTSGYFYEDTNLDPHSPYSASKASADLIVKAYYTTYGMPITITRCSNNYGPYQFPEKLIPLIINNALNHRELPIYGDGRQIRDWLYVTDHCKAIELVANNGKIGDIYNIGGHNEWENIDIVNEILQLLREKTKDKQISSELIKYVPDRPGHDRRYAIDPKKINKDLGWSPETPFEIGLELTIDWYLENLDWLKRVISGEYLNYYKRHYN